MLLHMSCVVFSQDVLAGCENGCCGPPTLFPEGGAVLNSEVFLAEILLTSSQKLFISIIKKNNLLGQSIQK